jgi:hypothetical protein
MTKMIDKIEINMINESVHNFRVGEFGVKNIEIDEVRGFIEVDYGTLEIGMKKVLIPLQNVEKCEFIDKGNITSEKSEKKLN